ncbi:tyrosinase cofactor [Streptomyces sp. TP-A0356]|uniref:apotyrosinase chaperone MelC1 n=1 Tax=Streptomyces sp. TP-A0356 TaxID=1359208 RepID=UPI0006E16F98|nr:tyrosinase cofactor [Streptomyces sp. TP-A0356]
MTELTRRRALVAGAAVTATAGLAIQAAQASAAGHPSPGGASGHEHGGPEAFDEVYQGRRIQGRPTAGGHHHGSGYGVFIDGVELHVMRNADGSWISVVNHYEPVPSPRAAARAAVVELQGAPLVPFN